MAGFRLHTGGEDQPVDPLIASLSSPAPAHRGIAYAVFEQLQLADFGNRIPSLTFELVADDGEVAIGAIARTLGEGAIVGDGPDDTLAGFAASGSNVVGALGVLADAAQAWFVPAPGGVAMRNRLGGARMLDADVRVEATRGAIEAVPTALAVSHYDPARDWQVGTQRAHRPGAGWRDAAIDLPAAVSAARGRRIAQEALLTREAARMRRQVTTDIAALDVAPGDTVMLPQGGGSWRVSRATLEGMRVVLDLTPPPVTVAERAADPGQVAGAPDLAAGTTLLAAFELPPLDDALPQVPQVMVAAAGTGAGWRAAALSVSRDGVNWDDVGATAAPATMGVLAAPVAAGIATLVDRVEAIEVDLAHDAMVLLSADAAALDRGANLALIGGELVQFARAEPVTAVRWRLTDLWRGRRGTAVAAHPAGARFVLIERDTLAALVQPGLLPGEAVNVSAIGVGEAMAVEGVAVADGVSVAPPAPVHLRAAVGSDGALALRWVRRSRLGWRWSDGTDAPLVEERERYRVTLPAGAGSRDVLTDTPSLTVPAGEWSAGPVSVRQIGTLAPSAPATIII